MFNWLHLVAARRSATLHALRGHTDFGSKAWAKRATEHQSIRGGGVKNNLVKLFMPSGIHNPAHCLRLATQQGVEMPATNLSLQSSRQSQTLLKLHAPRIPHYHLRVRSPTLSLGIPHARVEVIQSSGLFTPVYRYLNSRLGKANYLFAKLGALMYDLRNSFCLGYYKLPIIPRDLY